jgi:hypothetical protein
MLTELLEKELPGRWSVVNRRPGYLVRPPDGWRFRSLLRHINSLDHEVARSLTASLHSRYFSSAEEVLAFSRIIFSELERCPGDCTCKRSESAFEGSGCCLIPDLEDDSKEYEPTGKLGQPGNLSEDSRGERRVRPKPTQHEGERPFSPYEPPKPKTPRELSPVEKLVFVDVDKRGLTFLGTVLGYFALIPLIILFGSAAGTGLIATVLAPAMFFVGLVVLLVSWIRKVTRGKGH